MIYINFFINIIQLIILKIDNITYLYIKKKFTNISSKKLYNLYN